MTPAVPAGTRTAYGSTLRDTALVVLAALVVGLLAAAAVVVLDVGQSVRPRYGLTLRSPVDVPVAELWATNMRTLALAFVGALAVALRREGRVVFDMLLTFVFGTNVLLVAVAFGAYGWPLVALVAPHAALELLALAVAVAVYLDARRTGIRWRVTAGGAGLVVVLLAAAAVVEAARDGYIPA